MYKIIALMGEAGSGKDSCLKALLASNPAYHRIVSCTTRPPREGEIDGVDYYFISTKEFEGKIDDGQMFEVSCFNTWYYGTPESSLDEGKINVGVFNPSGINQLTERKDVELYVYYLRTSAKERLLRQLNREENPDIEEIIRRASVDKEDFKFINKKPNNFAGVSHMALEFFEPHCIFTALRNETKEDLARCVETINLDKFD